jgi:hypothetical protein
MSGSSKASVVAMQTQGRAEHLAVTKPRAESGTGTLLFTLTPIGIFIADQEEDARLEEEDEAVYVDVALVLLSSQLQS